MLPRQHWADCCSGSWKTVQLKQLNFNSKGAVTESGALHPRKRETLPPLTRRNC